MSIFTRPSILLPGVYNDNQNQRTLVFTGPGAQLYGTHTWGRHDLSFTGAVGAHRNVRKSDERLLIDLGGLPFDLRIEDSWNAQVHGLDWTAAAGSSPSVISSGASC